MTDYWKQEDGDIVGVSNLDISGFSVAISSDGSIVAVGAPRDGTDEGTDVGSVSVYELDGGGNWVLKGSIIEGDSAGDFFGSSVSLSANGLVLAVGAPKATSNDGYVEVYDFTGGDWVIRDDSFTSGSADGFGVQVELDSVGDTVVVAAGTGGGGATDFASVWDWSGASWTQRGLNIAGKSATSFISVSISSDGNIVAVGSPVTSFAMNVDEVNVYKWSGVLWQAYGNSIIANSTVTDLGGYIKAFGYNVSLSSDGETVAIRSTTLDGFPAGRVFVLDFDGVGNWVQRGSNINNDDDAVPEVYYPFLNLLISLSGDGNTLAVGSPAFNVPIGGRVGKTTIYKFSNCGDPDVSEDWNQLGNTIDGLATDDHSGFAVALASDAKSVIVGEPLHDVDNDGVAEGQARVFVVPEITCTPELTTGKIKLSWTRFGGGGYGLSVNGGPKIAITDEVVPDGDNDTYEFFPAILGQDYTFVICDPDDPCTVTCEVTCQLPLPVLSCMEGTLTPYTLVWDPIVGGFEYTLCRGNTEIFTSEIENSYDEVPPMLGVEYTYNIKYKQVGDSDEPIEASSTTCPALPLPTLSCSLVTDTSITLSWDTIMGYSYNLYRLNPETLVDTKNGDNTLVSYTDGPFSQLATVNYRLDIINSGIITTPSPTASCTTICILPGATILTPNGKKLIDDIRAGDIVVDENGKHVKVINNIRSGANKKKVITFKRGSLGIRKPDANLSITSNHPIKRLGKEVLVENCVNHHSIKSKYMMVSHTFTLLTEERCFVMTNGVPVATYSQADFEKQCEMMKARGTPLLYRLL